jgi:RND family efflux transporter MFP subunit
MNTRRNRWRIWFGVLLGVGLAGVLGGVGGRWLQTEVGVSSVVRGVAVNAVSGVVEVRAERSVELRVEVGGRVVESRLVLGGAVEAGDWLLRLDDSDLRRSLERVRIDLEAEEALGAVGSLLRHDWAEAREDLVRKEEDAGRVSARELEVQRRKLARLEDEMRREEIGERRRVRALRNEMQRLEEELAKTAVVSPVAGVVVEILAFPGDVLVPRGLVVKILSNERVVEANLSEENFAGVAVGQTATVRFLSYGGRLFPARVLQVLPAANPRTQRYSVLLEVDMPSELMVPGITGEVSIVLGKRAEALVIPRRALQGREVFVVREGWVEARTVDRGFISLNQVEVLGGLDEGDQVVVEKLDRLRDGDRVRIKRHGP